MTMQRDFATLQRSNKQQLPSLAATEDFRTMPSVVRFRHFRQEGTPMKRYVCLALVAVFAICLSVTAQQPNPVAKKTADDAAAKKAADDAKVLATVRRLQETEKALVNAWDAYKAYKTPQVTPPDVTPPDVKPPPVTGRNRFGSPPNVNPPVAPPQDWSVNFYNPQGIGSISALEQLSKTQHMNKDTGERVKLFAKVLICIAERDEAFHAMQKELHPVVAPPKQDK